MKNNRQLFIAATSETKLTATVLKYDQNALKVKQESRFLIRQNKACANNVQEKSLFKQRNVMYSEL